jgi:hypothetical protein
MHLDETCNRRALHVGRTAIMRASSFLPRESHASLSLTSDANCLDWLYARLLKGCLTLLDTLLPSR